MPRHRKTKQYQWQTETPKYLECELMKVLSDKEIELSRLKSKDKPMETTIKQLNSLNLDAEKEEKLVSELNYLSSLIVDLYSMEKANGQQETTHS
jgi:hypothetical protein